MMTTERMPIRWAKLGVLARVIGNVVRMMEPSVLLISLPRSGSSWIGHILGSAPDAAYLREPVSRSYVPPERGRAVFEVDCNNPPVAYRKVADVAFASVPRFSEDIVTRPEQWSLHDRTRRRLVIKEVNLLALKWFMKRYAPRVVLLVRHPAAVASSVHKLGWHGSRYEQKFLDGVAARRLAREWSNTPFFAQHTAFQASAITVALNALRDYSDKVVVRYEDACSSPQTFAAELFRFAGLTFDGSVTAAISATTTSSAQSNTESHYAINRNSASMVDAWRKNVSANDLSAAKDAYLSYGLPIYPADEW
jgi:hypothetical protein